MTRCISSRLLFLILIYFVIVCNASAGDRSQPFQDCLQLCESQRCQPERNHQLAFFLQLTRWTCLDDCKYTCTHLITDIDEADGKSVLQYYGKWPFWRLWGMQEPASVFFSLGNLWVHVRGYAAVKRLLPTNHPMRGYLIYWSWVSMNAWLWSSVFHTRGKSEVQNLTRSNLLLDTPSTERWDYFSAALAILSALHFTASRFFFVGRPRRRTLHSLWTVTCILVYLAHISYLSILPRFDYSYNIVFNLIIGLSHNLLWVLYSLPSSLTIVRRFPPSAVSRRYRPNFAGSAALCVGLTMAAMSLELLDFPAFGRILDAHALWHAATIPISSLWYKFLIKDALDDGWKTARL